MNLRDYQWFRNPRGLHNTNVFQQINLDRYIRPRLGWAKLITGKDEYYLPYDGGPSIVQRLIANRIMPVIRIFRTYMGALRPENDPQGDDWYGELYPNYIAQGVRWFELYNEPNLAAEWPGGGWDMDITWENRDLIQPLMDSWIDWAERLIQLGGYPAFPALAESADYKHATVYWMRAMLLYLREHHETRFRWVLGNGLWCATHPYIANHFYQEPPGGPPYAARQPHEQRASEPGWHFEYPYDPLQQRRDPGRTVFGGTALTPNGDPNGLIASGLAFQQLLWKYFRGGPVPVLGTEGGIWRIPAPWDPPHIIDDRYPGYTWDSHAEATMAMWSWIAKKAPPWFFGVTTWSEPDWYDINGTVPVVQRMEREEPVLKAVPNIEVRTGETPGLL